MAEDHQAINGEATRGKQPLYRSVSDTLRHRLTSGAWAGGARLPALRELATEFRVSTITVRQALRLLEREGHLECIPAVGTFVRPTYPSRAAMDQATIALATIEIEGAFTSRIAHSIEEGCHQRGWALQILNAQDQSELEVRNLRRLAKSGVTGAIIIPTCENENLEEIMRLKLNNFPFVLVDRSIPGVKVDVVGSDHEQGAYAATSHLLEHGHTRVLLVTQPSAATSITERTRGYERALVDHGLEPLREWKVWIDPQTALRGKREHRRWFGGYEAALPVLKGLTPPVAVFAHNAYSGWGVFEACRELGLRIPEDVSLICFDDSEFARALHPALDAVAQRTDEIARTAIELLERRIRGGTAVEPQHVRIEADLIQRGSVARAT